MTELMLSMLCLLPTWGCVMSRGNVSDRGMRPGAIMASSSNNFPGFLNSGEVNRRKSLSLSAEKVVVDAAAVGATVGRAPSRMGDASRLFTVLDLRAGSSVRSWGAGLRKLVGRLHLF